LYNSFRIQTAWQIATTAIATSTAKEVIRITITRWQKMIYPAIHNFAGLKPEAGPFVFRSE